MRLLKTSIARVRYGELPPGTVDRFRGSYSESYNSGTALGAAMHWRLLEPPRGVGPNISKHKKLPDAEKTALHMSSSGAASGSRGQFSGSRFREPPPRERCQEPPHIGGSKRRPLGAWSCFWKPFLVTI